MPTVDASINDLSKLVGKKFTKESLEEALLYVKGEIDGVEGDSVKIDIKETNRPDLWSAEGIARELKARLGLEKGLPKYKLENPKTTLTIEKSLKGIRPYIVGMFVSDLKVNEEFLEQMIQLQEKMGMTYGRKRTMSGAGLYDSDKLTPPMFFRGYKPRDLKFPPLEFEEEMYLDEILERHPKGKEFRHLLDGKPRYPIVIDSKNVVGAMPPIINSNTMGKVTEKTKNIFVEVTSANSHEQTMVQLSIFAAALADRGAKIESIKVIPIEGKPFVTPDMTPKETEVDFDKIKQVAGINFSDKQIEDLLSRARYEIKSKKGSKAKLLYPAYRQDIIHPMDVIEDVLISYGYNNFEPEEIKMAVTGSEREETLQTDLMREIAIGLGLQEVMTFTMTSKEKQEEKIGLKDVEFVEIANYVSINWQVFRKLLFPELLEFLSKNKHVEYPQKIFEIGKTLELDNRTETKVGEKYNLCIALADREANFTNVKSALDAVCNHSGWNYKLKEIKHPAFVEGRVAEIDIEGKKGLIGELNQKTLENFGLNVPISILELQYY